MFLILDSLIIALYVSQVWIYEHFTVLRGKIAAGYDESQPRMKRWSHCSGDTNKEGTLIELRQKMDKIAAEEVSVLLVLI